MASQITLNAKKMKKLEKDYLAKRTKEQEEAIELRVSFVVFFYFSSFWEIRLTINVTDDFLLFGVGRKFQEYTYLKINCLCFCLSRSNSNLFFFFLTSFIPSSSVFFILIHFFESDYAWPKLARQLLPPPSAPEMKPPFISDAGCSRRL